MKKMLAVFLIMIMTLSLDAAALAADGESVDFLPEEKPAPEDDFYAYVNFDALRDVEIPVGHTSWSSFTDISLRIEEELDEIVDECVESAGTYEKGTPEQKIADLYLSFVDAESRNAAGLEPIQPYLDLIQDAGSVREYMEALSVLMRKFGFRSLFSLSVDIDMYDSNVRTIYLSPADTGLSKAYLDSEEQSAYWDIYKNYLTDVLTLYGLDEAEAAKKADAVFSLQRRIAAASLSNAELYDYSKSYQPTPLSDIAERIPEFDAILIGDRFGSAEIDSLMVVDPGQLAFIAELLTEGNLSLLKDYSIATLLCNLSYNLTMDFRDAYTDYTAAMTGAAPKSLEEISKTSVQSCLPWDFGRVYVKENFPEKIKRDVEEMVSEMIGWYRDRIDELDWMSDETKAAAQRKLDTMNVKIGYPDDYGFAEYLDELEFIAPADGGSLIENFLNMRRIVQAHVDSLLNAPVDRTEWEVPPQTINAYYNPLYNEIIFPAAIIRGVFYDPDRSRAANLGGIGMVIGHEITHAFDSSGAMFDEYGNLNQWWTDTDLANFQALQREIADYYGAYEILPGIFIDGELTLAENIADLGALHCVTSLCGDDPAALRELFTSFATIWATKKTRASFDNLILNDTHSPEAARVNAVVSTLDAFYAAYDIEEGDGMYVAPENRVGIW